jgi:hypothetical protein
VSSRRKISRVADRSAAISALQREITRVREQVADRDTTIRVLTGVLALTMMKTGEITTEVAATHRAGRLIPIVLEERDGHYHFSIGEPEILPVN